MIYGCHILWQNKGTHIDTISKLQNQAMSIINCETYNANTNPLYINHSIVKLLDAFSSQARTLHDMVLICQMSITCWNKITKTMKTDISNVSQNTS